MFSRLTDYVIDFCTDESGQGLNEYAFIIAFVGLIVAMVFGIAGGKLSTSLSGAFSSCVHQIQRLNSYTSST